MRGKYRVAFVELLGGGWIVEKNCPTFAANFGMILLYLQRDRGAGMSLAVQAMDQVFNSYRHRGILMRSVSSEWELLKYY